ncbi:sensor histidine kinase [Vaginella massiliensis]|uniref:sensor histidine kinase n=1 Tax=Vaginella massiliensis TaxID=1816680 RepID=UPI000838FC73|nr:HAMP domain-containing sensor histidine kinase [Vaginella massiliensis]
MKKGFYKVLISVMSVALIGLMIIQFYWLKLTFDSSKENFNTSVYQAMNNTADKINKNELNTYYQQFANVQQDFEANKNKPEVVSTQAIKDSVDVTYVLFTRYILDKTEVPISGEYNDSITKADVYKQESLIKIPKDSSAQGLGITPLSLNYEEAFKNSTYSIERFARLDAGSKPIDKRISIELIDSIFKKELKNRGIHTTPEIGILKGDSALTNIRSKNFRNENTRFSIPLFYDKDEHPAFYFNVYFPQQNIAILGSSVPILALTFILTIIIISVFSLAIYYMQLQRNISEIKTDFINNMTHEFKTPIATINIASDALKNEKVTTDPEKVKYYADLIKQENKRMNSHVEMVLRMSKLERNQMDMNLQDVEMDSIIEKALEPIRFIVSERSGTIFETYQADRTIVHGDAFHLENIIINILDNARKYSIDRPEISIKTYNQGDNFVLEVKDKGMGMSPSVLKKIFEKFYREETGNVHNVKGHGLGLAYVKKIVELHQGNVWAESKLGEGSTFYVKLPLKK